MANEHSGVKFFVIYTIVASLVVSSGVRAKEEDGDNPLWDIAQSLLQESVQNQRGGSGLATLLQAAKGDDGGFDPAIVGTMVDLFSTLSKAGGSKQNRKVTQQVENAKSDESSVDWEGILNIAGNFISTMSGNQENPRGSGSNSGFESLLSFLPVLLSSISGQHNIHASKSIPHHSHEQFLPPILENLHEYWDHFTNSEFGKTLWKNSRLSELVKLFTDMKGQIEVDKIFGSLEDNSFRRMWVTSISSFVAKWVKSITNPEVQVRYLETAQLVCNGFLEAQGYPKNTHLDLNRPAESISALADSIFQRQFNLSVNSGTYVRPAVSYIQEIFRLGQKKSFGLSKVSEQDIEAKLAETLDGEIIEPILRTYRAFKYGSKRKGCAKYVICAINQPKDTSKSGLKPGITKLASLIASWFMSLDTRIPFWDFYQAAVKENGCRLYDKGCTEFDSQDLKATTEYFHNELSCGGVVAVLPDIDEYSNTFLRLQLPFRRSRGYSANSVQDQLRTSVINDNYSCTLMV